ncbi:hypothetical protein RYX36_035013 [Vicia faba]
MGKRDTGEEIGNGFWKGKLNLFRKFISFFINRPSTASFNLQTVTQYSLRPFCSPSIPSPYRQTKHHRTYISFRRSRFNIHPPSTASRFYNNLLQLTTSVRQIHARFTYNSLCSLIRDVSASDTLTHFRGFDSP